MQTLISKRWCIPFIFLTALLLRFVFIPNPGFEADMSFWKSWGLAPFDFGFLKGLALTNNNYPTPFGYLLWAITTIYSVFQNPHLYAEFWSNTNLLFLTLMKLPAVLADLGIGAIIIWFTNFVFRSSDVTKKRSTNYLGIILAVAYLFNPVSILDSAVWGQVDSLGVFLFLAALVLCFKNKPFLAGLLYMVALMTKLQNMIYGPLFFLLVWQITGLPGLIKSIAGAVLGFFGLNIEFLMAKNMGRVIESLTVNYDYFPSLSLNAYNPWWIVAKGTGMQISDKLLAIGLINAKTLGLIIFSSFYFLSAGTMLVTHYGGQDDERHTNTITTFFVALIIATSAFFLFQTESHDRYAFPIIVFLLFWIPLSIKNRLTIKERESFWKTTLFRNTLIGYIIFSCLYFLNMHTALIINYPRNGLSFLSFLKTPTYTIFLSYMLSFCFFFFLFINRKTLSKKIILLAGCFFVGIIIYMNLPLITNHPVSLTKLTPFRHEQQYGVLSVNMPMNAKQSDSKTWDRLSVQYMFYPLGLGTHANSTIIYDIGNHFSKFSTDYGVDTEAGDQASVVFSIYGDDTLLFESPIMKRYDFPKHQEVTIKGVKQLKLTVSDAGNGNTDDHADWVNPVLFP